MTVVTAVVDVDRCSSAFSVFYAFVYRPMLRRVNHEIKATRVLLTLLPNDVVTGCKDIKQGISAIIAKLR
jgi:hypothetical protein